MASTVPQDFGTPLLLEEYTPVTSPMTPDSPPLCAICHTSTSPLRCSTCKTVYYCSSTCQTLDWPTHKLLCKQLSTSLRPNPSYRRALYLPDQHEKPRFVWLQYGEDGRPLDKAKCFPTTPANDVKTIAFHNRYRPYWIQISYDSNPNGRTLTENVCVKRLLGGTVEAASAPRLGGASIPSAWRGPLVVIAYSAEEGLSKPALDVDTGVLGPVVEYLRLRSEYEGPVFVEQPQEWIGEKEWEKTLRQGAVGDGTGNR